MSLFPAFAVSPFLHLQGSKKSRCNSRRHQGCRKREPRYCSQLMQNRTLLCGLIAAFNLQSSGPRNGRQDRRAQTLNVTSKLPALSCQLVDTLLVVKTLAAANDKSGPKANKARPGIKRAWEVGCAVQGIKKMGPSGRGLILR